MGKIVTDKRPKSYKITKEPKPLLDRKVQVWAYVPFKHYKEVQLKINELLKQYR